MDTSPRQAWPPSDQKMTVPLQAKSTRAVIFIKFAWFGTFRLLLFDHITPPLTDYTATSRGGVFSARGGVFSEWRCNLSKTAPNRSHGCSSTEESMGFVQDFVEKCFEIRQLEHAFSKICNGYKPPTSMTPKWSKNDGTVAGQKYIVHELSFSSNLLVLSVIWPKFGP